MLSNLWFGHSRIHAQLLVISELLDHEGSDDPPLYAKFEQEA